MQEKNMLGLPGEIMRCIRRGVAAKALVEALKLELFTVLQKPRASGELAKALGFHPKSLQRFLVLLSLLGLVEQKDGKFVRSAVSARLLSKDSPDYIGAWAQVMYLYSVENLTALPEVIKSGPEPEKGMQADSAEFWAEVFKSSANVVHMGDGDCVAGVIASLPGADGFGRMLDLGGGHGLYSVYTARALPGLRVDIFDLPGLQEQADAHVAEAGLEERLRFFPGDYQTGELPGGYDVVLARNTLNFTLESGGPAQSVLKVFNALNAGGRFVSIHDARLGAPSLSLDWPFECYACELVAGVKMAMPDHCVAEAMLRAGFRQVLTRELDSPGGLYRVDIGIK